MGIIRDIVMPLVMQNKKHTDALEEIREKGETTVSTTYSTLPGTIGSGVAIGVAGGLSKAAGSALFEKKKDDGDNNKKGKGPGSSLPKGSIVLKPGSKDTSTPSATVDSPQARQNVWQYVKPETVKAFDSGKMANLIYPKNYDSMTFEQKVEWLDKAAEFPEIWSRPTLNVITNGSPSTVPSITYLKSI